MHGNAHVIPRVDFEVIAGFEVVLITKGSQGIPGYVPNRVTNTTEYFNRNFKCIYIAKIANVLYEVENFSC